MEDLKPSSREEAVLAEIAGIEDPMVDAFEPSSREEWFMNKIAEKMAEGGGGSGGGGSDDDGGPFVITGTFNEDSTSVGTVDKTTSEIEEALENNREVVFALATDDTAITSKLAFKSVSSGTTTYAFPYWEGGPAQIVIQNGAFLLLRYD